MTAIYKKFHVKRNHRGDKAADFTVDVTGPFKKSKKYDLPDCACLEVYRVNEDTIPQAAFDAGVKKEPIYAEPRYVCSCNGELQE